MKTVKCEFNIQIANFKPCLVLKVLMNAGIFFNFKFIQDYSRIMLGSKQNVFDN